MTITCPHCASSLLITGRQVGDRIHHARCGNWVLLAQRAELDAARAVVRAATLLGTGPDSVTWTAMYEAIEAYDAAVKARR